MHEDEFLEQAYEDACNGGLGADDFPDDPEDEGWLTFAEVYGIEVID